jgi:hypothetical protein
MPLSQFQDSFAQALQPTPAAGHHGPLAALVAQPGFAVYRNTVLKGCIDALQANYPTVCSLVGQDWFGAAAQVFVQAHPPSDGRLMAYGLGFADFLAQFEPAAALPYLADVAQWDRRWTECHLAADAPTLDAPWLARQSPDVLGALRLHPHPATRWAWCSAHPAYTLWQRHRDGEPVDAQLQWLGDGGLLTRPDGAVQWRRISSAGCAFLNACARGLPLQAAAQAALAAEPDADLAALMALLLQAGALCPQSSTHPDPPHGETP